MFGDGDGKLETPEALERRMEQWQERLGVSTVFWREKRTTAAFHFSAASGYRTHHFKKTPGWDDFDTVPRICHRAGVKAYLYVTLFDEGWALPPKKVREVSYHNAMHGRHWSRQSAFTREHPAYLMCDRTEKARHWGVPCLAHPEVRRHYQRRYLKLLGGYDFDGLFVCLRSQSKPVEHADQFGFNAPIRDEYKKRYGKDIRKEDFALQKWRELIGDHMTRFLAELRDLTRPSGLQMAVGIPSGEIIGPPMGNWTLQWRKWVQKNLIDDLVINQNSSQCPSMWHLLWPMHRGYGYIQNYIDQKNMSDLNLQIETVYRPILSRSISRLYVSRQWDERDSREEAKLLAHPVVSGLVFSTFRFDNSEAIRRGDWRA